MAFRQQFPLLKDDAVFLDHYGLPWETIIDGSNWVLVHEFPTHEKYNYPAVSIAVRIEPTYPRTQLDMVYVYPFLERNDGRTIGQVNVRQPLDGKNWQRWSRHRSRENPWRSGEDSLETHIYLIEDWFVREFERKP